MRACPDAQRSPQSLAQSLALPAQTALPAWLALPALLAAAYALLCATVSPATATAVFTSAPAPRASLQPASVAAASPTPLLPSPTPESFAEETAAPPPPDLSLIIPVADVAVADLADTWGAARSAGRRHHGIDIMAPTGRPIFAAADGVVIRMVWNGLGGRTISQRDASGEYIFYYAHLEGYAPGLETGAAVHQGDLIGYVGSTGNATTPHLHFEIMRQPNLRRSWGGKSFNPYPVLKAAVPGHAVAEAQTAASGAP